MMKTHLRRTSLVLALLMLLTMTACHSSRFIISGLSDANLPSAGEKYHTATSSSYTSIQKSGLYELMYDEANFAIGIRDTSGFIWYSLPSNSNKSGAMLSLLLTDGKEKYALNSQDHSVAFGTATVVQEKDSIAITYKLQDKAKGPNFSIPVTLNLKLDDGQLIASVDASKIDTGKYTILSLSIMPTFGTVASPTAEDFILLPDGCGGKISLLGAENSSYVLDVYGRDPADSNDNPHPALFGAYGVKHGNSAFAGIVTSGDALTQVKANVGDSSNAYICFNYPTDETLSVAYKFISGSSASYAGIASMCREQFTRDGKLSTRSVNSSSLVPLAVTVTGGTRNKYENIEDMANVLKVKGINSLIFKYDGVISKYKIAKNVGSKSEFDSMRTYFTSQGFKMYLTMDYMNFSVSSVPRLTSKIASFMKDMKVYNPQGYCISDVGSTLTRKGSTTRQEFADGIFSQTIALSTNKHLMVENGNLYTLKNASVISGIPMTTTYQQGSHYEAVPFAQMILHGTVNYMGIPFNENGDISKSKESILKSVEYGALPTLRMNFDDSSDYFYDNLTTDALDLYNKFNNVLSGVSSEKIIEHKKLQKGLYMTEYNNGSYVYVNYTNEKIEYNGITIPAMNFLRVN